MNKALTLTTLAVLFTPSLVMAESANTITFQGEVADQTCSVSVNGNAESPVVLLPTVAATDLTDGLSTGTTNFSLGVTGCTAPASSLNIGTVFVGNNVTAAGNLGNTGIATNVVLQLLESDTATDALDLTSTATAAGLVLAAGETEASHNFAVRYFAEGGDATAGTVISSVQYALTYQ